MKRIGLTSGICAIILLLSSCIEPFKPDIGEYSDALVVEGRVLEGKRPAYVKLTRTYGLNDFDPIRVSQASVSIRDDQGNEYQLTEVSEGEYLSDTSQWEGIPGRSYQLFIRTSNGQNYESSVELMKRGIPIDNVDFQFQQFNDDLGMNNGVRIFVNGNDPENKTHFYRWEYEETWQFSVPYPALGVWDLPTRRPIYYDPRDVPRTCWRTEHSKEVILLSTEALEEDRIRDFPVRFLSTREPQLYNKVSVLIKQYSISEATYNYWRNLERINEDPGGFFDPIPTELIGNIKNVNDPEEPILGYFSADGMADRRIFISRQDLPAVPVTSGYEACVYDTLDQFEMGYYVRTQGVYVQDVTSITGAIIGYGATTKRCADCTVEGTREKPDFWE